jgi:hypothetical protein
VIDEKATSEQNAEVWRNHVIAEREKTDTGGVITVYISPSSVVQQPFYGSDAHVELQNYMLFG